MQVFSRLLAQVEAHQESKVSGNTRVIVVSLIGKPILWNYRIGQPRKVRITHAV